MPYGLVYPYIDYNTVIDPGVSLIINWYHARTNIHGEFERIHGPRGALKTRKGLENPNFSAFYFKVRVKKNPDSPRFSVLVRSIFTKLKISVTFHGNEFSDRYI